MTADNIQPPDWSLLLEEILEKDADPKFFLQVSLGDQLAALKSGICPSTSLRAARTYSTAIISI